MPREQRRLRCWATWCWGCLGREHGRGPASNRILSRKGSQWGRSTQNSATAEARLQITIPPTRKAVAWRGRTLLAVSFPPCPCCRPPFSPAQGVRVPQNRGGEKQQEDVGSHRGMGPGVVLKTHARSGPSGVKLRPLPESDRPPESRLGARNQGQSPLLRRGKLRPRVEEATPRQKVSLEPGLPRPTPWPPSPHGCGHPAEL